MHASVRFFFYRSWIFSGLGLCLFTTACQPASVPAPARPQPTCISNTPESNPYIMHPQEGPANIFRDYKNGLITYDDARQKALSQLGINVKHWSDKVDLAADEYNMVRIMVTYLDPALIQYIVLNHTLATASIPTDFDLELKSRVAKLGERNEMLFIITVTSPFYREQAFNANVLTVRIPIEEMALISASDVRVFPTHEDQTLDELIDITHGPVFGIVGYPFAIQHQDQGLNSCLWIIDQWSNTLVLEVPSVTLGATKFERPFWNIPYRPLVMETNSSPIATFDPFYDTSRLSRLEEPPTPTWAPNAQTDESNWKMYWEDMGRFIWNAVIMESHH